MPNILSRYSPGGVWLRGNTHLHSTASDGALDFGALSARYSAVGYHFLARTDHRVVSCVSDDTCSHPLVWLDGVELDGEDRYGAALHVVALGTLPPNLGRMSFTEAMEAARAAGALLVAAHPARMGNTVEELRRHRFDGIEIWNHTSQHHNGKGDSLYHWNLLLADQPDLLAFAVDDAHFQGENPPWMGGWVEVLAHEPSAAAIVEALRLGSFVASYGPSFEHLANGNGRVEFRMRAPVSQVRLVGPAWCGLSLGAPGIDRLKEGIFEIPPSWSYAYLEAEDRHGRRAWTQNLLFTVG